MGKRLLHSRFRTSLTLFLLGLISTCSPPKTEIVFGDVHVALLAEESIFGSEDKVSFDAFSKDFYAAGGRVMGIAFALPEKYGHPHSYDYLAEYTEMFSRYQNLCLANTFIRPLSSGYDPDSLNVFISIEGLNEQTLRWILHDSIREHVLIVGLVHNEDNDFARSSYCPAEKDNGISPVGRAAVMQLIENNIIVDISHFSSRAILDAVRLADSLDGMLIASHSGVYNLVEHPRNLSDEEITRISSVGGRIGSIFHLPFLEHSEADGIDAIASTVHYLNGKMGSKHVMFGSDYCNGISPPKVENQAFIYLEILKRLKERGYSDEDIHRIALGNLLDLLLGIIARRN